MPIRFAAFVAGLTIHQRGAIDNLSWVIHSRPYGTAPRIGR